METELSKFGTCVTTPGCRPENHRKAATILELLHQLDELGEHYNEHRPDRSNDRATPGSTYRATVEALPNAPREGHYPMRYDHVGDNGKMSLRLPGRMRHPGIGIEHRGKRVIALIDETIVAVVQLDTGEIIAANALNPDRSYWRTNQKKPGRWPVSS